MSGAIQIVLTTQKAHAKSNATGAKGMPLDYEIVTSVELAGRPKLTFKPPGYGKYALKNVPPGQQIVRLTLAMALRLEKFVETCFVQGTPGFDCFSFVDFLMGFTSTPKIKHRLSYNAKLVGPENLLFTQPYMIGNRKLKLVHAMLGWFPGFTLGVNGLNSELAICPIVPLVRAYGGTHIYHITGTM